MFLLVLDKDPIKSANLVPDGIKFKQLIELGQLICSAGISDVYKPIKQGKELQEWITKHKCWTYNYLLELKFHAFKNIKIGMKTASDIEKILYDLVVNVKEDKQPTTAIFRYSIDYSYMTKYPTNEELPINECVKEYKKYVEWKKLNNVRGYK